MSWAWQLDYDYDFDVGYVRSGCAMPGIDVIGETCDHRILILGGLTAPQCARQEISWAHCLEKSIRTDGMTRHQVLNGDTEGYVSGQELLRLLREGIPLRPHHVIVMSGANNFHQYAGFGVDRRFAGILKTHPFIGAMQAAIVNDVATVLGLGRTEVFYGVEDLTPPAELWVEHMRIMRNLCSDHGVGFTAFLRPDIMAGREDLTEEELIYLRLRYNEPFDAIREAHRAICSVYARVRTLIADMDWIVDLSTARDAIEPCGGVSVSTLNERLAGMVRRHLETRLAAIPCEAETKS